MQIRRHRYSGVCSSDCNNRLVAIYQRPRDRTHPHWRGGQYLSGAACIIIALSHKQVATSFVNIHTLDKGASENYVAPAISRSARWRSIAGETPAMTCAELDLLPTRSVMRIIALAHSGAHCPGPPAVAACVMGANR